MNAKPLFLALSVLLVGLLFAGAPTRTAGATSSAPDANPKAEALIDQLTQVDQPGVGYCGDATFDGFVAINQQPVMDGGILGSPPPTVQPAFRLLVQKGAAALPELIAHLSDARPTKLVVSHDFPMGDMWYGTEYQGRADPLPHFDTGGDDVKPDKDGVQRYNVCVGDLCYAAIGQIVNRALTPIRYQPTGCIVVNSPVHDPELAEAVRKDWGNATGSTLEDFSLVHDVLTFDDMSACYFDNIDMQEEQCAMERLCYYYPGDGASQVVHMLERPTWDQRIVRGFIDRLLLGSLAFNAVDITNPDAVYKALHSLGNPIGQYIADSQGWPPDIGDKSLDGSLLADQLNALMTDTALYDKSKFDDVGLSPQTIQLSNTNPAGFDCSHLNRLLIDDALAGDVAPLSQAPVNDPATWQPMFQSFSKEYGDCYTERVKIVLYQDGNFVGGGPYKQICAVLCPEFHLHTPNMILTADNVERAELLGCLTWFRSDKIDACARRLFASLNPESQLVGWQGDDALAICCLGRFSQMGISDDDLHFCRERIKMLSDYPPTADGHYIEQYKTVLAGGAPHWPAW